MTTKQINQNDKTFIKKHINSQRKCHKFVNISAIDVILGPSPKIYIVHSDMKDVVIAHIN